MTGEEGGALSHWAGEPVRVWEAVLDVPRFEAWRSVGSTNDRLGDLAREGASAWTVVVADEQRAGRGRSGRRWSSPAGGGLWMSVLLRPGGGGARLLTPLLVGLAVARAVEDGCPGLTVRLKWPNDVLVAQGPAGSGAEGREVPALGKVGGILCEGVGEGVVAGIGLNIRQSEGDFPPELQGRAVSLAMAGCVEATRAGLAGAVLRELRVLFARPTPRITGALAEEMRARDALFGLEVGVEGGPRGVARGIDPGGALLVEAGPGDVRRVVAGSVRITSSGGDPPGQGGEGEAGDER